MSRWRQIAKTVAHWTVPMGVAEWIRLRRRRRADADGTLSGEEKGILDRNRELRDRHAGERCFILATGPSIKKQNLKLLKGETCIAVSNFFVHPDYKVIQPKYYCVAGWHPPITEEAWRNWMKDIAAGSGSATMFFSLADRIRIERQGVYSQRQAYYLHDKTCDFDASQDVLDITRSVPKPCSVSIMALEIAIYMGFQEIYLLGCDHDAIMHHNVSRHFYDEKEHAMVRSGYNEWDGVDVEFHCQSYLKLWGQFKSLRRIAVSRGIRISNATEGGMLDVFENVALQSLFTKTAKIE